MFKHKEACTMKVSRQLQINKEECKLSLWESLVCGANSSNKPYAMHLKSTCSLSFIVYNQKTNFAFKSFMPRKASIKLSLRALLAFLIFLTRMVNDFLFCLRRMKPYDLHPSQKNICSSYYIFEVSLIFYQSHYNSSICGLLSF